MIKNEIEYRVTKEHAQNFEKALAALHRDEEKKNNQPIVWQLHHDGIQSMLEEFLEDIAEYEMLQAHDCLTPLVLKLDDIDSLSDLLIKARIAAKFSQKELAELSNLTEEQIQQYEAKDYQNASFLDVLYVCDALDIKIQKGELLVPLDTLRRTPITMESLKSSSRKEINAPSPERSGIQTGDRNLHQPEAH